jgi:hypothetical protein
MNEKIALFKEGTPVNAVNASKVLTISGVVKDGETLTINNQSVPATVDVYEFLADTAQSKTAATNIAVNILAYTTKATGTLTLATQPTAGDTMTIGTKVYTFVALGTAPANGTIVLGTDLAATKLVVVKAINGSTDTANTAHPLVTASAFNVNVCTLTAIVGGADGDVPTTETFTAVGNVFGAVTLESGSDCTAANAVTALVAAITASDTQGIGAADGAGDTVVLTADVAGTVGNDISIAKVMTNGTFAGAATKLSGGVNGTLAKINSFMVDASYVYFAVDRNTTSGKNWRRVSLGSAF